MIYFVKFGEHVKIGYTSNFRDRARALRCSNPFPMEILGIMDGSQQMEKKLHETFKKYRTIGEWFSLSCEIKEYISINCSEDETERNSAKTPSYLPVDPIENNKKAIIRPDGEVIEVVPSGYTGKIPTGCQIVDIARA